jgi:thiosulfate dehydrogenase [quinone] large subunit
MATAAHIRLEDPPFVRALFDDTRLSWVWTLVRLYIGYQWLTSGLGKVTNPAWMDGGLALKGYWTSAVAIPAQGKPPISYDWYRDFLNALLSANAHTWFAKLIAFGEIAIGVGLIVGAVVGLAAFFGAFMNMNFLLAGTASTNPVLLLGAILLIAAWKTAGYWGLDRFVLPTLASALPFSRSAGAARARPRAASSPT